MAWRQVTNSSDGNDFTYWQDDQTGEMTFNDPTPGVDDAAAYENAQLRQVWDATPGDVQAKLDATANQTGRGIAQVATWAQENGLATNEQLQANLGIRQLADRGYYLQPDGQIYDGGKSGFTVGGHRIGFWPIGLGVAAAAAAGAAGAAGGGSASGAGAGELAGAYGGMDAAAVGGADYGLGSAAAGSGTAGMIGTDAAIAGGTGATGTVTGGTAAGGASAGGGLGGSAAGGGAAAAGGTALSRILGGNGEASAADWASILGTLGATGLGVYGANQHSNALTDIANQARADRAPFLNASTGWLQNPDSYWQGPGKTALDANLRALSANGAGNPIDQPTSLGIATQAGLADWRNAVTGFGNLGLAGEDSRNNLMAGAAGAENGIYNSLGYGLSQLTNPPTTIEQLLKQMKGTNSSGLA